MDLLYRVLIYLHVSSVIVSIGPFFVLLPLVKKLRQAKGAELEAIMDAFRFAVRLTMHAGHVLVTTGILMVVMGPWTWKTPWIVMTLFIMFCSLFFLARAFSPKLRKLTEEGQNRSDIAAKLNRSVWTYIFLLMAMLWFMVVKPSLW
ncbi:hypothetical protein CVD28_07235 [Bacillus sp. M6-12]|uniref:DUF2269 family protein n=1 Tax=Bacillus sp. M6-12 TaxID=2054166 RepID=UPI000C76A77A|nr:DUF2269 family protein [Bacillus sp. M6-12]PLS18449.1 hypothetical protein CVD28_07235 [Bacillus sp. M6-12]